MEWTAALPTQPGIYWHWAPSEPIRICEVIVNATGTFAAFTNYGHDWFSLNGIIDRDLPPKSHWFGPIEPPTPPEQRA